MTDKAGIGDQNGDEQVCNKRRSPGGDVVRSESKVRVGPVCFDSLYREKEEDPDAANAGQSHGASKIGIDAPTLRLVCLCCRGE